MADFPTHLASLGFGLEKHEVPQIESQTMGHALMNSVNATFFQKYVDP